MTAKEKKTESQKRIDDKERFKYIGFEVFPGKPKDLFRSDSEKAKYVEVVQEKRSRGQSLRDNCTLTEERVTRGERIVLTVASLVILLSLFVPWYAGYTEVVETSVVKPLDEVVTDVVPDTLVGDTSVISPLQETPGQQTTPETQPAVSPDTAAATAAGSVGQAGGDEGQQQMIHGLQSRRQVHREVTRVSALGAIFSLGTLGSYVFSSGFILVLVGLFMIIYTLLCIGLPVLTMYEIYAGKGTPDERALRLKKYLKLNWIPVGLFVLTLVMSFFGAGYGFANPTQIFTSLGSEFDIAALMNTLSWGAFISFAAFILLAVKAIEI